MLYPKRNFARGVRFSYEESVEIDGGRLPAPGDARTAAYTEGYLQNGYRYFYKVSSRAGWWYPSGDSNVVSFVWTVPPKAPQGLRIEAGDRSLALSWELVTENIEEKPLEHGALYQVYRKSGNEDFAALREPVQEVKFIDAGLINAKHYSYMVRALVASAGTVQAGSRQSGGIRGAPGSDTASAAPESGGC